MTSPAFDPGDQADRRFTGYGPSPIPNSRDDLVDQFLDQVIEGGSSVVASVTASASERGRRILRAYTERMASLAVRHRDAHLLVRAVVALVLGGLDQNIPEALMLVPLIENSAKLLQNDLSQIFEEAAGVTGHPGSVSLMMWLTRAPQDRTLASMGFVEASDEGGFRYQFSA